MLSTCNKSWGILKYTFSNEFMDKLKLFNLLICPLYYSHQSLYNKKVPHFSQISQKFTYLRSVAKPLEDREGGLALPKIFKKNWKYPNF